VYGHRNLFEFRLSTRLMYALVNLAPVNKGRAGNDDFDDIFIVSTGALFNF